MKMLENSLNGLTVYSNAHICEFGIIGIVNLHVDFNYSIRSIEYCQFKSVKDMSVESLISVPTPTKHNNTLINISNLDGSNSYRLIIRNIFLSFEINIGNVDAKESPLKIFASAIQNSTIEYYESNTKLTSKIIEWFEKLVFLLDFLPPPKLGLIFESIFYIHGFRINSPSQFDLNLLKLVFVAHEIYFEIIGQPVAIQLFSQLLNYSANDFDMMSKILLGLIQNPKLSLLEQSNYGVDFITTVFYILLLEKEGLIKINRPGIIASDFDLDSAISGMLP